MLKQAVAVYSVMAGVRADPHTMNKILLPDLIWLKDIQHFHKKQSNTPLIKR